MRAFRTSSVKITKILLIVAVFALTISAQNTLARFEKSIEDGKLSEVESDLFNYVIANPQDAGGFALLAKMRLKQNRFNEAKSLSKRALSLDETFLPAKLTMAFSLFQSGEIDEAKEVLSNVSEIEIKDTPNRLILTKAFATVGNCEKALKTAEKLPPRIKNGEALSIRAACYLETGDNINFASLIPIAKTLAKLNRSVPVKFAEVLSKAGMHKETIELLRLTIASAPKNFDALLLLAKSEIYLKDFASAKIRLAQAEKIQPKSGKLLFVKSLLESEQGNNSESLDLLEKSLALNPNNSEVLTQFVITAIRANQSGKAVRAAENLVNLQPANLDFLYLYGAALLQNNNLQKAETLLTKFLEARPNDSRGCLVLGLTFAAQPEKNQAAREQMQKCLTLNPNDYEAAYQLGLSYKTQGETAKAIEYLEQTVRISPNYAPALRDLGATYLQSNEEAKARPVLEKAVSLNPNDADTHFQLSRLYNLTGERELAKKHLEIFQKLKNPKKDGM